MGNDQDSKKLSKERFTKFADGYVSSPTHAKGDDLNRLVELAQPQKDWNVLDVATGGGHTALKFAPHVGQVTASDLTPRMLEKAQAFIEEQGVANISFKQADAENLPFEDGEFDLVTCRIAPHHFPDCAKFVREAARVLKPGGRLLMQDQLLPDDEESARYVDNFERTRDPSHHRAFSQPEWVGMFENAKLKVSHTEEITKRHQFHRWAERQGNTPEMIETLTQIMYNSPPTAISWMDPHDWETERATFIIHHILVLGIKD